MMCERAVPSTQLGLGDQDDPRIPRPNARQRVRGPESLYEQKTNADRKNDRDKHDAFAGFRDSAVVDQLIGETRDLWRARLVRPATRGLN